MTDEQIVIDGNLLGTVLRRNAVRWIAQGMVAAAVLTGIGAMMIPQSYTSTASVAVQAPQQAGSALSMLTGSGGQTKRYIGILKSRSAAMQVESAVHLQKMYNLPTQEDALDLLGKALKPDDNAADGLLYIRVTLPGPPRLMPAAERRDTVRKAAASTSNAYVRVLRNFYLYNDTDRDAALVRGANEELARMRTRYDVAFERLRRFTNSLRKIDPRATPADSPEALATTTGLPKLYEALGVVETQISGLEAGSGTEQRMVAGQLGDVSHIPTEDPLLTSARLAVDNDKASLALLENQYGPQNPSIVATKARLRVDQARLAQQIAGIREKQTTRQVGLESQMESLRAKRDSLTKQIAEAESHLNTGRQLSSDYLSAKTEWQLSLAALTASETEVEKVRMENVSAQSRLTVIDNAVPADKGSPSLGIIVAVSTFLALVGILVAFLRTYSRESRKPGSPPQPLPGGEGL